MTDMPGRPDEVSGQAPTAGALDFERVHVEFRPRVGRYLARLVGAREADDLTQETFLRVSQALGSFRGECAVSTWVYRIATNLALDRLRSPSFQVAARQAPPETLLTLGTASDVEQKLARGEMGECIRGFIERLPVDHRSVLVLSELEELPDREIAEVLGLSLATAKIRLHRARARLRELLECACALYRDERNELACEPRSDTVSSAD
jgi:RNA polymerase sigma-70 factor (ECF subfamily)